MVSVSRMVSMSVLTQLGTTWQSQMLCVATQKLNVILSSDAFA